MKQALRNSAVAAFLGKPLLGEDQDIHRPADLAEAGPDCMVWVKGPTAERLSRVAQARPALVIGDAETCRLIEVPRIVSLQPRLDFLRVLVRFFKPQRVPGIHPTAIIEPGAIIGRDPCIGPYTHIGPHVRIGDDCNIGSGVSIEGDVTIGDRCIIKANSVLGDQGFGFEYDEDGVPQHFPHLGKLVIEDDVWVGAGTHVGLAALGTTRIGRNSKVDDLVQVGHNSKIGPNSLIMANSVLCGGAIVGASCWIAPNSVIKQKVRVGDRVTVGLGTVVIKDVEDDTMVVGVPARPIKGRGPQQE